jgi:hypothetical protein
MSIEIKLQQEWALDTSTGDIFVPTRCRGMNPIVCRAAAQYGPQRKTCTRGIITGDRLQREECSVDLKHGSMDTYVEEIKLSQYVIVTWGETIREYCAGTMIKTTEIPRGVHFIEVQFGCKVTGIGWQLVGYMQGMEQISIASLQVPDIPPFDLPSYIPNEDAQRILAAATSQLQTPEQMITMTLKPIKLHTNPLKTIRGIGNYTGWFTLVIIILAIPIAVYHRYRTSGVLCPTQDEKTTVGDGCMEGYSAFSTCLDKMNTEKEEIKDDTQENTPFPIEDVLANACTQEPFRRQIEEDSLHNNKRKRSMTDRVNMKSKKIRAEDIDMEIDQAVEIVMRRPTAPPAWEMHSTQL